MKKYICIIVLLLYSNVVDNMTIKYVIYKSAQQELSIKQLKKLNTKEFVLTYLKIIRNIKPLYSVDKVTVLLAQMILEGGQGRCVLVKYNNWFGITGNGIPLYCNHVNKEGDTVRIISNWKVFKDFKHCLLYKEDTLMRTSRYIKYHTTDTDTAIIQLLYKGGYFGHNKKYIDKITILINKIKQFVIAEWNLN